MTTTNKKKWQKATERAIKRRALMQLPHMADAPKTKDTIDDSKSGTQGKF